MEGYVTPITSLDAWRDGGENRLFVKRDDLYPFSFGGNKARKAQAFFESDAVKAADAVVTYGSLSSNHCRVVANMAAAAGKECYIVTPKTEQASLNDSLCARLGARRVLCPIESVSAVIAQTLTALSQGGKRPAFIPGGGHGLYGTKALVECYAEIAEQEKALGVHFDYIFLACGTGATQAGLICGQLLAGDARRVVGISIARQNPHCRTAVLDCVNEYLIANGASLPSGRIEAATLVEDAYTCGGYGKSDPAVAELAKRMLCGFGLPLDTTYTAKALWGMTQYLAREGIREKNLLFLHTGGTPLFFDDLQK